MEKLASSCDVSFGCDPEVFLVNKNGDVIGCEWVVPDDGLRANKYGASSDRPPIVVRDGVQAELHIASTACRATFSNSLSRSIATLEYWARRDGASISLNQVVNVKKSELSKLSDGARIVGCAPSLSIYGDPPPNVDGSAYPGRSAGGHIHLGYNTPKGADKLEVAEDIVAMLDVFVGNTSVLLDRDKKAAERRELYGRAGEFRLKPYGLEYRTLSNFWLHSPHLVTLILGLCDTAVSLVVGPAMMKERLAHYLKIWKGYEYEENYYKDEFGGPTPPAWEWVMSNMNLTSVRQAINTSSKEEAMRNFRSLVHPFFLRYRPSLLPNLEGRSLPHLYYLVDQIEKKGIKKVFGVERNSNWTYHWSTDNHNRGWGDWCHMAASTVGYQQFMKREGKGLGLVEEGGIWKPVGLEKGEGNEVTS